MTTNFIPPLRIEVRAKKAKGETWSLLDTAQTETQAADKIQRAQLPADAETRVVPNTLGTPIGVPEKGETEPEAPLTVGDYMKDLDTGTAVRITATVGKYRSGKAREGFTWESLAAPGATGFCPAASSSCFERITEKEAKKIAAAQAEKLAEEVARNTPPPKVDAIVGSTPLPFAPGDTLRDVHTGTAVRVTAINGTYRSGAPRAGFAWETVATKEGKPESTGFCPLQSIGCFAKAADDAKPQAKPSHKEKPLSPALEQAVAAEEKAHTQKVDTQEISTPKEEERAAPAAPAAAVEDSRPPPARAKRHRAPAKKKAKATKPGKSPAKKPRK